MSQNQFGQLKQYDLTNNVGGTNLVDSVFKIDESQAAGGINFDYILTGGVRKRLGAPKINSVADTQLESLGFGLYAPTSGLSKSVFRAAGTKLELFDTSTPSFTPLTQDVSAAPSTPFSSGTSQNVQMVQFSSGVTDIMWSAGGGAAIPIGAYSTTKYTQNGVATPTGSFSGTPSAHGGGSWSTTGQFYWAVSWVKRSTSAESNTVQDFTGTITNTDDTFTITLTPPSDTTLYQSVNIYRSSVAGTNIDLTGFTTGDLIATLASTVTTFVDHGDIGNPDILQSTNVPRAGNIVLDNSQLPSGTYNTLALWGHRLCTSSGNNVYISDVNKSESWPLTNYITVPSAGPITALATISYTSAQANSLFELLVIFKEREVWVLNPGNSSDYTTWSLLKIDSNVGCPNQSLVVTAQGFLAWIDWRGVWLWDGTSKPIYTSRLIEPLFGTNGDLDKSNFDMAWGAFFRRENQIKWFLSSKTYGVQKFSLKMDVRLTLLQIEQNLQGRTVDGTFIQDTHPNAYYAGMAYVPLNGQNEQFVLGDASGFCYFDANSYSDGGGSYPYRYLTSPIHCGNPNMQKLFHKVIVWVQDVGNWNLYLDYWSDYATSSDAMSSVGLPISTQAQNAALWDIAVYDYSSWDSYTANVIPLIFNLQPGSSNSAQGTALQLQFRNDNANEPITIHGFSIVYSEMGGVTA